MWQAKSGPGKVSSIFGGEVVPHVQRVCSPSQEMKSWWEAARGSSKMESKGFIKDERDWKKNKVRHQMGMSIKNKRKKNYAKDAREEDWNTGASGRIREVELEFLPEHEIGDDWARKRGTERQTKEG